MNIGSFIIVPQACRLLFFSQSIFLSFRSVLLFHPQVHWIYLLSCPILIVNLASRFFSCYSIFQFCDAHLVLFCNFYFIAGSFYFLTYFKRISNWQSLALSFFGIGMKTALFQSCGCCWVFQICWHIECSTFTASSFRIWNRSPGIPSPPLALFVVMLSKAHLTSHSRMFGSRWVNHTSPSDYLGREDLFCTVLLCILVTSS